MVDHAGFTYRATNVDNPFPFVIVSSPVRHTLRDGSEPHPYAYDVCKDRTDNPVRAVVFAETTPTSVTATIGGGPSSTLFKSAYWNEVWKGEVDTTSLSAGTHDVTVTALVGGETASHTITALFVDGPCDTLPDEFGTDAGVPDSGAEAGPDDGGSTDSGSAGGGGVGGSGAIPDGGTDAGSSDSGVAGDGDVDAGLEASNGGVGGTGGDDGGCGCQTPGIRRFSCGAIWVLLGILTGFVGARWRQFGTRA